MARLRQGAQDYMVKPVNRDRLSFVLRNICGVVGRHVLLVDDNPTNLLVARSYLNRLGLEVETADNGLDAVDKAARSHFAAILMDLQMPGIDGFAATRIIRASGNQTPIIALTANAMPRDVERGLASGFHRYLTKPINIDEFNAAINSMHWSDAGKAASVAALTSTQSPGANLRPSPWMYVSASNTVALGTGASGGASTLSAFADAISSPAW